MLRCDYSWTDSILSFWATLVLTVVAVTSLVLRYVTSPISCWMPDHFTPAAALYTNWKCFNNEEIYLVGGSSDVPDDESGAFAVFTYHQWVPFALGIAALLCLVPHATWRLTSGALQLDTHALLSTLADNQRLTAERRHVMLRDSAILLQSALKRSNSLLTLGALCRKLLACVTCLVQLALAVAVFHPQLSAGASQDDTEVSNTSIPLPRSTFLCAYEIRRLGRTERFSVQCIMPLAEVYDKALAFLFYFFLLLLLLCGLDLVFWIARVMFPGLSDLQLKLYTEICTAGQPQGEGQDAPDQLYTRFAQSLGWDGRLVLALTADYCGPVAAADLTNHLWVVFKQTPRPLPQPPPVTAEAEVTSGAEMETIPLGDVGGKDEEKATEDQGSGAQQC